MPATRDDEWTYWDTKLTELRRCELETVHNAAKAWSTLFAGVLGLFGTVAFAGGLTTIDDLPGSAATVAKVLTLGAFGAALVATVAAAFASNSMTVKSDASLTTGKALRQRAHEAAQEGLERLKLARWAGLVAAACVVVGSVLILVVGKAEPAKSPPTAVVVIDGRAVCGKLERAESGDLAIGGTPLKGNVVAFSVVAACPESLDKVAGWPTGDAAPR